MGRLEKTGFSGCPGPLGGRGGAFGSLLWVSGGRLGGPLGASWGGLGAPWELDGRPRHATSPGPAHPKPRTPRSSPVAVVQNAEIGVDRRGGAWNNSNLNGKERAAGATRGRTQS